MLAWRPFCIRVRCEPGACWLLPFQAASVRMHVSLSGIIRVMHGREWQMRVFQDWVYRSWSHQTITAGSIFSIMYPSDCSHKSASAGFFAAQHGVLGQACVWPQYQTLYSNNAMMSHLCPAGPPHYHLGWGKGDCAGPGWSQGKSP